MKNITRKREKFKELESMSLNKLVGGSSPGDVVFVQIQALSRPNLLSGDLAVCNMSVKPKPFDLVVCQSGANCSIRLYSDVWRYTKPLRLIAQNGKKIKAKIPFDSAEVIGVITHVLRTFGAEVTNE